MKKFLPLLMLLLILIPATCLAGQYSDKLKGFLDNITTVLYFIGTGIALIVILVGGITYMTAADNEENIKKAKKILVNGLIGAAILVSAAFIIKLLQEFLGPLK